MDKEQSKWGISEKLLKISSRVRVTGSLQKFENIPLLIQNTGDGEVCNHFGSYSMGRFKDCTQNLSYNLAKTITPN